MRARILAALMVALPVGLAASQARAAEAAGEQKDAFKLIHVDDLQKQLKAKDSKVVVYDANGVDFRKKWGVVPGAKLLSGLEYDAAKELPADKATPIVFYCANTH